MLKCCYEKIMCLPHTRLKTFPCLSFETENSRDMLQFLPLFSQMYIYILCLKKIRVKPLLAKCNEKNENYKNNFHNLYKIFISKTKKVVSIGHFK